MMELILNLALAPASATFAGVITWLLHRDETLEDGALVRHFVVLLIMITGSFWGVTRTDAVRMRLEPSFRIEREIQTQPLITTLERLAPDDANELKGHLAAEMSTGTTLNDSMFLARPALAKQARYRSGFADQQTRLAWARYTTDTLKDFANDDPMLCYRLITNQPLERATLIGTLGSENFARFQAILIRLYESADQGMRHERMSGDRPADFNEAAREYSVIQEEIEERFGAEVAAMLRRDRLQSAPASAAKQLCAARIYQLEAMQRRPQAMAALLVDSVLR